MRLLCSIVLLFLLEAVSSAAAPGSTVDDKAKLFSSQAIAAANAKFFSIDNKNTFYGIIIETCPAPTIPAKVQANDTALQNFLNDWARENHKLRKLRGAYIVITKDPTYVQVQVTADLYKEVKAVSDADLAQWKKALEIQVAAKRYDAGLKEVVNAVNAKLEKAPPASGKAVKDERSKGSAGGGLKIWHYAVLAILVPVIVRVGMGALAVTKIKKPAPGTRAPSTGTVFLQAMLGATLSEKFLSKPQPAATYSAPAAAANPKPAAPSVAADDNSPFGGAAASQPTPNKAPAAKGAASAVVEANPFAAAPAGKASAVKTPALKSPAAKSATPITDDSNPFA